MSNSLQVIRTTNLQDSLIPSVRATYFVNYIRFHLTVEKLSGQEQNLLSLTLCIFSSLLFSKLLVPLLSYGYCTRIYSVNTVSKLTLDIYMYITCKYVNAT